MSPHGTRARYAAQHCRCEPCKTANSEYSRRYYRAALETSRERARRYYERDPEGQHVRTQRWRAKNQERMTEIGRAYRARRHYLYNTWSGMKQRCQNPNDPRYYDYGGRGITVSHEWDSFEGFRSYIEEHLGPRPEGRSLDRIANDGPYEPGNVRWATASEQQRNSRRQVAGS